MKNIFAIAVAMTLSVFSVACSRFEKANSNTAPANLNSPQDNAKGQADAASSTETNKEQLLSELVAVYREYLKANIAGDKEGLEHVLANDFTARLQNQLHDKASWIGEAPGYPNIASNNISNPELVGHMGDTATVHTSVRTTFKDNTSPVTEMISISYVKRDGRWQIKSFIVGR